ncbi:hypothetical protein ML153_002475 [Klebsiella pneumoniae]|nr:hypothetical protein [Klebsiella pneumoniae]HCD1361076.1 hypothetical protein [Klebsiella pneumoniae subsp. pneumoniae]EIX9759628.1 hypothetical protein [Klebsiella pneumoniae]HDY4950228.1 hypothetical protein [Klebsiella pneumoniae]HDY9344425.1 hypothetical protein [Klebsiella pneumoniae]
MTNNQLAENSVNQLLNSVRLARDNAERADNRVDHSFYYALTIALEELQERRKAAMDSEPVAEVVSIYGDHEAFGEREIRPLIGIQQMPYGTKLYLHAQPAPVVPKSISVRQAISALESAGAVTTIGQAYKMGWNACRAAMLQAKSLTTINPAPTLVSLPKNAKSLTGNSPVIGIDLASGPDRTVEVHYVVPPGYVVVPKEPTDEMIAAAMNCEDVLFNSDDSFCIQFVNIYEAMLAAAPKEVK